MRICNFLADEVIADAIHFFLIQDKHNYFMHIMFILYHRIGKLGTIRSIGYQVTTPLIYKPGLSSYVLQDNCKNADIG